MGGTGNLADYIIEQGEGAGWFYRKWFSGYGELFIREELSSTNGYYQHSNFPFEVKIINQQSTLWYGTSENRNASNFILTCANNASSTVNNTRVYLRTPDGTIVTKQQGISTAIFMKWK